MTNKGNMLTNSLFRLLVGPFPLGRHVKVDILA
jgi:hypothetical protein